MCKILLDWYYLDYFYEFLSFFDGVNWVLLIDDVFDFIDCFKVLDDNVQCIVVRVVS